MLKVFLIVFLQNVPVFRKGNTPPIVFIPLYHSILHQVPESYLPIMSQKQSACLLARWGNNSLEEKWRSLF
jgi:hypothetical protein